MVILFAILFIVFEIIGFKVVDWAYRMYMSVSNADSMYYNGRKKIIISFLTGGFLFAGIVNFFI